MKYEVFEKVTDLIIEKNIKIDKEIFDVLLKITNYNSITEELMIKILEDENIKDKTKFLDYMIKTNESTRSMNILLKILNDEKIREDDRYIKLIMYKFDDIAREYVFENLRTNKFLENDEILNFLVEQSELIQIRILKCLKNGLNNEQIMRLMKIDKIKVDEVLKEIEIELLEKNKRDLEEIINKVYDNPSLENLKDLKLKRQSYNEIVGIFKTRNAKKVKTDVELDNSKKLILVDNLNK